MKIICVYAKDETTDFLAPVYEILQLLGKDTFKGFIITNETESEDSLDYISRSDDGDCIFFLGHGAANHLYLNKNEEYIGNQEFYIFKNKRIFLLACYSALFIKGNSSTSLVGSVGFGGLVTDWEEVKESRIKDANAYSDLTDTIVTNFANLLAEIIRRSISYSFKTNSDFDFKILLSHVKLFINKKIIELLVSKPTGSDRTLANLLFEVKDGLYTR